MVSGISPIPTTCVAIYDGMTLRKSLCMFPWNSISSSLMGYFVPTQLLGKMVYITKHANSRLSSRWKFWILVVWLSLCLEGIDHGSHFWETQSEDPWLCKKQPSIPESTESSRTGCLNHELRRHVCLIRDKVELYLFSMCVSCLGPRWLHVAILS